MEQQNSVDRPGEAVEPAEDLPQVVELGRLRGQVEALERALVASRRETLESHARLTMISKIVRDVARCERAPRVTFGAVRAALYNEWPPVDLFG